MTSPGPYMQNPYDQVQYPAQPRRRGGTMVVIGIVLTTVGLLLAIAGAVGVARGVPFLRLSDSGPFTSPFTHAQQVTLTEGRAYGLYLTEGTRWPECRVSPAEGLNIPATPTTADVTVSNGSLNLVGHSSFTPSATVTATIECAGGSAWVGPTLSATGLAITGFVLGIFGLIGGIGMALLGLVLAIIGGLRR